MGQRMRVNRQDVNTKIQVPGPFNWRTTDEDEINRRRLRATQEVFDIRNISPEEKIFSNFQVHSRSGMTYFVEIRDLSQRRYSCTCPDFRTNGLGSCKHVEAVLLYLEARFPKHYKYALLNGSSRIDVVPDLAKGTLFVERGLEGLPRNLRMLFNKGGLLQSGVIPEDAVERLSKTLSNGLIRLSQDVEPWLEKRLRAEERLLLRREYEQKVLTGEYPPYETIVPLYPYQREGMLHLAFCERALLADEMGLGKTIQAIAACALLHRLGSARHTLVVTPASLKTEWEEQIQRFTRLPYQIVFGPRRQRLKHYQEAPFFTLVNYEQVRSDALEINVRLKPDIVILDEAQRIKNWSTATAQSVKRLSSRYAFVLTGTPIENRIDEIYSIIDFLDPTVFGPLFRFNREFYELDERGRPEDYKNLDKLHERVKPLMIRRLKADVEDELPNRTDRNFFVALSPGQQAAYEYHEKQVARLLQTLKRRPLTKQEQDKLMRELSLMRMICDTNYILDPTDRVCPKLKELEKILDEVLSNPGIKVVLFSEWVRMLELVKDLCEKMHFGYAWHTGDVPQRRRRAEIQRFKADPMCRVFICSESGGLGLNLQNASVVINCDLPWNPAKLEQRIARVWRKHQTRAVDVINLISEETIEHRMLDTLAAKQGLADGVLDRKGDLSKITMKTGAQTFLKRLEQIMERPTPKPSTPPVHETIPVDRAAAWTAQARELVQDHLVLCEERYPMEGPHSVLVAVVDRDADSWREKLSSIHENLFGPGRWDPLSPVHFDVIDRASYEAIRRLEEKGLIVGTVRATRPLYPDGTSERQMTDREKAEATAFKEQAARKLKMARLLLAGGMDVEARPPMIEAIRLHGCRLAIENHLPVPETVQNAVAAPLSPFWQPSPSLTRQFLENASTDPMPLLVYLENNTV